MKSVGLAYDFNAACVACGPAMEIAGRPRQHERRHTSRSARRARRQARAAAGSVLVRTGLLWTPQIIKARIEVALECRRDQRPETSAAVPDEPEPTLLELRHIVARLCVVVLDDRDGIAAGRCVILSR